MRLQVPVAIHRVNQLDLKYVAWTWPFAIERRADIDAHFALQQAGKPKLWNGRVLLGRNPAFSGDRFSADYFEADFASFLAWRDWGFPDSACSTVSAWARCVAMTARLCSARWLATRERRADLFSGRDARSR